LIAASARTAFGQSVSDRIIALSARLAAAAAAADYDDAVLFIWISFISRTLSPITLRRRINRPILRNQL